MCEEVRRKGEAEGVRRVAEGPEGHRVAAAPQGPPAPGTAVSRERGGSLFPGFTPFAGRRGALRPGSGALRRAGRGGAGAGPAAVGLWKELGTGRAVEGGCSSRL